MDFLELANKEWTGKHLVLTKEEALCMTMSQREEIGNPCLWVLTESDGIATVYLEYSQGRIGLMVGNEITWGATLVCLNGYAAIDKDYYGSEMYLYKTAQLCQS